MLYIEFGVLVIAVVIVYVFVNHEKDNNVLDDIPTVNINDEELKKHAAEISTYYSQPQNIIYKRKLIKSLDIGYREIIKGYEYLDNEIKNKKEIIPAAEWLLDNLYLIEKEYKDIKYNIPQSYFDNLPIIGNGMMKGYPRIYHISVEIISHTDGKINEDTIINFIEAYQKNSTLTISELWSLSIMLRVALIQNISKTIQKIVFAQEEKKKAELIADELIDKNDEEIKLEVKKLNEKDIKFNAHFTERLLKILRDNGIDNSDVYNWIDEKLLILETNTEKMINIEHQKEAAFRLTIGNSVTSIREVSSLDWRSIFEKLSLVEHTLEEDPLGLYNKMDFSSKDFYRRQIQYFSKKSGMPELFIAKKAIECSIEGKDENEYEKHVGYYLIDNGSEYLAGKIGIKDKAVNRIEKFISKHKVGLYISTIVLLTIILITAVVTNSYYDYRRVESWKYIVAIIAIVIPCSEIVISIFNWSINHLSKTKFIPKLEFKNGIPEEYSTVVVIPTLLNSENRVHDLINDMEVYYLANSERNIYYALLGDFKDSDKQHEKNDESIIQCALKDIEDLNNKYRNGEEDIFYFFNRCRQYNHKENKWMGWERKRGKLMEFNQLLRGSKDTSYNTISGNIENLTKVKYVITLDADTQLPRDSAKKLIGAMSHALNKGYIDNDNKKVIRGHGLMQPRISVGSISANKTFFSKTFSGETGIDIYTTAISDVYEDLFDEGIFTGKGIYDVDIFNIMLENEIPENTVLSHDLLEGSYVRAALLTDVELIDGYPAYYNASCKRLHRWVRGDWQLIPWITKKSPLNKLSRWKILDNLRRSLLAPSIIILVLLSMNVLPGTDRWLIVAFLALVSPILFDVSEAVITPIKGISLSGKVQSGKVAIEQFFLIFCFLTYQAYLMLDAIFRTLYRVSISKKNLLEWQTAADVEASSGKKIKDYIKYMWQGSLIALLIGILAFYNSTNVGLLMLPSCIIWFVSPFIAYYISKDQKQYKENLSNDQVKLLRRLSRKTWAYFEDFINDENNWLAPDNYQEKPENGVAHRTSPTNLGMGLTSNVVAFDLGYIGVLETIERIDKILSSMEGLKRYKGHFYNWYDTKSKEPLEPKYVSTVDSGNLVGYLWLVSEFLNECADERLINRNAIKGIEDVLLLANEEVKKEFGISDVYNNLIEEINVNSLDLISWKKILLDVWAKTVEIEKSRTRETFYWNNKLKYTVSNYLKELQRLYPWVDMLTETQNRKFDQVDVLNNVPFTIKTKDLYKELQNIYVSLERVKSKNKDDKEWVDKLKQLLATSKNEINNVVVRIDNIRHRLKNICMTTDFTILYDSKRQLFSIGYDVVKDANDNCYYDLLASEARQASFVAIAKGDIEQINWFKLGRSMTLMNKEKGLVSWSGTMFEYFMPLLIMKTYPDTLLNQTYKAVVEGQKNYCREKRVPWGISESAFNAFDVSLNYQYKAFGVPGIGLKRGLSNELVIAPYATVLAMLIDLKGGYSNVQKLIAEGLEGRYGLYEAVDYTKDRLSKGKKKAVIKCFMVHHEGMSLMALDNVLNHNLLQERFHRVPEVKATELLLQERVPKIVIYDREQKFDNKDVTVDKHNIIVRKYTTANTEAPEAHLMSNGSYSIMVTNSGSGYSKLDDTHIYRWKEDSTNDKYGMFFYVKNLNSNEYWSTTYEPCKEEGDEYEVTFSLDKAEFHRKDGNLITNSEITVSNEDNAEIRTISITNSSEHKRVVEVTSYSEVTLTRYNADIVHPTFSNLFIRTEFLQDPLCIIANRRPRAKKDKRPWLMQTVVTEGKVIGSVQYETSRANFIGRCRDVSNPKVMENDAPLENTVGAVLDPIISLRIRVEIPASETCKIVYATAIAESREEVVQLAQKYRQWHNIDRIFELAWTQTQVDMRYMGIKSSQANLFQLMASKIMFINDLLKKREGYIQNINRGQSSLWSYGISGDLPIVLLIIRKHEDTYLVRQMLKAHEYWSMKGLKVDLVILNLQNNSYIQALQDSIRDIVLSSHARDKENKFGGVFLYSKPTMSEEIVNLIIAISRLVIDSEKGNLITQIKSDIVETEEYNELDRKNIEYRAKEYEYLVPHLEYFNELGGFDLKDNKYVIILKDKAKTPAPWINVISNGKFGFHVSENGVSYSWYKNSRENKITTWSNDPLIDGEAEEMYLRDEYTGEAWSISPKPIRDNGKYIVEHGFGYSTFRHEAYGIIGESTMFVPMEDSVKLCIVKLKNNTNVDRKLSITYYAQLVLGVVPQQTAQYISTYLNSDKDYIYGMNPYSEHFGKLCAYLKTFGGEEISYTGDRKEFIGRGRDIYNPKALSKNKLSNNTGSGYDPCLAVNSKILLKPDEEKYIVIMLGEDESVENVNKVVEKYGEIKNVFNALDGAKDYWNNLLGKIKVETPDKTLDIMVNGWLMYQTISCRIWARTAFYQSGGAYGFRDQLQDVMSLSYLKPDVTRKQILYSASRQFIEGDVQHWWHPVVESGIRTRFSDDLLWLPYVTIDYIKNTGDYSILNESALYMEDEPLKEGEDERYNIAKQSNVSGTIFEHCIKAIERALKFGEHNIPLMGSGDWNDGMSTVGNEGKGESVWLGWFLYSILTGFIEICNTIGENDTAKKYSEMKEFIQKNLEANAWDGGWYRRAYFDDGTPLGSIENDECQIDSLSQSWSVISGAGKKSRAEEAIAAVERHLVKKDYGMVLLLSPAFDSSYLEPGYIKGYVPGVRENGGQYTHAAVWFSLALSKMGYGNKAWEIFNMINPINHTRSYLECQKFKVEPYVMTADVYAVEPHYGRGGWSWYTGAAGWMYRAGIDGILGLKLKEGKGFTIEPCIPDDWKGYKIKYTKGECIYNIEIIRGEDKEISLDGKVVENKLIPFLDGGEHSVKVVI